MGGNTLSSITYFDLPFTALFYFALPIATSAPPYLYSY